MIPIAKAGLLKQPLDDQVLVYDPAADAVHLLDKPTACVLEVLEENGWTGEGLHREISTRLGVATDHNIYLLAVDSLNQAGLLAQLGDEKTIDISRREMIRKSLQTGAAALTIGSIISLSPNTAYAQASGAGGAGCPTGSTGAPPGSLCNNDSDCCGTGSQKCLKYGGSNTKRCCLWDKGTGKKCTDNPSCQCCSGICNGLCPSNSSAECT